MIEIVEDILTKKFKSAYIEAVSLKKGKTKLEERGYNKMISLEENVGLMIYEGKKAFISQNGNWVKEGSIYIPQKDLFLTRNSPVLELIEDNNNRSEEKYLISGKQIKKALEDSVCIPYNLNTIPTKKIGKEEITKWMFGKNALEFRYFLEDLGIKKLHFKLCPKKEVDEERMPFAYQLWFGSIFSQESFSWGFYVEKKKININCCREYDVGRVRAIKGVA